MAKLIELHVVYDSDHTMVSELCPARILIDVAAIETVLENPRAPRSDDRPQGCRITLNPGIAEFGEGDEVAQGQRVVVAREPYDALAAVLADERGILRVQLT